MVDELHWHPWKKKSQNFNSVHMNFDSRIPVHLAHLPVAAVEMLPSTWFYCLRQEDIPEFLPQLSSSASFWQRYPWRVKVFRVISSEYCLGPHFALIPKSTTQSLPKRKKTVLFLSTMIITKQRCIICMYWMNTYMYILWSWTKIYT